MAEKAPATCPWQPKPCKAPVTHRVSGRALCAVHAYWMVDALVNEAQGKRVTITRIAPPTPFTPRRLQPVVLNVE